MNGNDHLREEMLRYATGRLQDPERLAEIERALQNVDSPEAKYCAKQDQAFCAWSGIAVGDFSTQPIQVESKRKRQLMATVMMGIVGLSIAFALYLFWQRSTDSETSQQQALKRDFPFDYEGAIADARRESARIKEVLGESHPQYATSLSNLAEVYAAMGKYQLAELLYEQSREIMGKTMGETHPCYATSISDLAKLHMAMGDYARAAPLFEQSLDIKRKTLPWLCSIYALDHDIAWVAGRTGEIFHTQDGFQSGTRHETNTDAMLLSIFFRKNGKFGWVAGTRGTILHTDDGGQHWETQATPTDGDLRWIHFVDDSNGWAVGQDGLIIKTNNAGKAWERVAPGKDNETGQVLDRAYIDCVYFSTLERGFTVAENGILSVTNDGGKTWQTQSLCSHRLWRIFFYDDSRGWIVGDEGTIFSTSDGGIEWTKHDVSKLTSPLQDVHFVNNDTGWIVGQDVILHTTNGGGNWEQEYLQDGIDLWSIDMVDSLHGWAVGRYANTEVGVVLQYDNGQWRIRR